MGTELAGSDRPLIVTSGIVLVEPGRVATETVPPASNSRIPRVSEQTAYAAAEMGARVSIIRLPPSVHGAGDHGFVPILIGIAREKGASVYTGEGLNRWPAVHRLDAAKLYRLVLEKGRGGARYHAVAEEGVPFREIAGLIGKRLSLPVVSKAPEESAAHFGWFAHFAAIDNEASSALTRQELGWEPTQPGLIEDVDQPAYFQG
ncbi:MAG: hypothetical protein E5V65_16715 [Mesorhizobium sp.]|nr:MAG: hypothetical protein E5V65_16715 [Mesorhizobium sp.]